MRPDSPRDFGAIQIIYLLLTYLTAEQIKLVFGIGTYLVERYIC